MPAGLWKMAEGSDACAVNAPAKPIPRAPCSNRAKPAALAGEDTPREAARSDAANAALRPGRVSMSAVPPVWSMSRLGLPRRVAGQTDGSEAEVRHTTPGGDRNIRPRRAGCQRFFPDVAAGAFSPADIPRARSRLPPPGGA